MPATYTGQKTNDPWGLDEYKPAGAGQWFGNIGGGAASGALAGSTFGPWGSVIGGVVGAGVGAFQTAEQNRYGKMAWEQQDALNRDLGDKTMSQQILTDAAMRARRDEEAAVLHARQVAAAKGLSPEAAAGLEVQARQEAARNREASMPGIYEAAANADLARRQQTLAEYETAQSLANNAAPPDYGEAFGQLAGAVSALGASRQESQAFTPTRVPPVTDAQFFADPWAAPAPTAATGMDTSLPSSTNQRVSEADLLAFEVPASWGGVTRGSASDTAAPAGPIWSDPTAEPAPVSPVSRASAPRSRASAASAATGRASAAGPATGQPGASAAVPTRAPLPPPGQATTVLPATHEAVASRDIESLLSRSPSDKETAVGFLTWKDKMLRAGMPESSLTFDSYVALTYVEGSSAYYPEGRPPTGISVGGSGTVTKPPSRGLQSWGR